jgi:hypothetical protein
MLRTPERAGNAHRPVFTFLNRSFKRACARNKILCSRSGTPIAQPCSARPACASLCSEVLMRLVWMVSDPLAIAKLPITID